MGCPAPSYRLSAKGAVKRGGRRTRRRWQGGNMSRSWMKRETGMEMPWWKSVLDIKVPVSEAFASVPRRRSGLQH